jgi:tetratricopeptide (TPR) repeat protein
LEKYEEAITIYKETFKYEDHEPTTYFYIAECYENINDFESALVNYNKCVKIDPANADAWLGIGVVLDALNRLTEGVHYIKKAIEINPNNAEYWYVFAEIQEKLGFAEEAAMAYQRVIELEYPDYDVWLDYSKLLHQNNYITNAIETLIEGIKYFPDVAELYYRMGIILLDKENRKESLEYFEKALSLDYSKHNEIFEYAPVLQNDKEILNLISNYKTNYGKKL